MKHERQLVSIIVTCYNYADYVPDAIRSVAAQTYNNIELIVINDGSKDDSDRVIQDLKKKYKFRYINTENQGIIATRNLGLDSAKGDYQIQLDADDTIPENYVKEMLECALQNNADIVYADYVMFGDRSERSDFPEYSLEELKNHNFINISALVRVKSIGEKRFDPELTGMTHEDWDFFLGLCVSGAVAAKCKTTHLNYRMHGAGRNNVLRTEEDKFRYAQMFMYIMDKHFADKPQQFEYLAGRIFAPWFIGTHLRAEAYSQSITELNDQIALVSRDKQRLQDQLNSTLARRSRRFVGRLRRKVKKYLQGER